MNLKIPNIAADVSDMSTDADKLLKEAGRTVAVTGFLDYRRYLGNVYNWVKARSDSFSYITFSIQIGLGKSNASRLIITGERNLAEKSAAKVAENIGLKGYKARYFEHLVAHANARTPADRDEVYQSLMVIKSRIEPEKLDDTQIKFYGNWLTPVLREMIGMNGFVGEASTIQDQMNFPLRLEEVKKSLQVLVELGFLKYDGRKETYSAVKSAPESIKSDTLTAVAYHQQMIEQGKESLTRVPGRGREVSGCTTRMTQAKFERLKSKLKELLEEAAEIEEADAQEVYQLNVQLFPFTKLSQKK